MNWPWRIANADQFQFISCLKQVSANFFIITSTMDFILDTNFFYNVWRFVKVICITIRHSLANYIWTSLIRGPLKTNSNSGLPQQPGLLHQDMSQSWRTECRPDWQCGPRSDGHGRTSSGINSRLCDGKQNETTLAKHSQMDGGAPTLQSVAAQLQTHAVCLFYFELCLSSN